MSVLRETYQKEVIPALMEKFKYSNIMQVPEVEKIIINMGVGEAKDDPKVLDHAVEEMSMIVGQKPVVTKAKKSVANFKIRAGMPVGCKVTLRGEKMYDFLYKLVGIAMPRIRDFRGISAKAFDGRGNYSLGLTNQTVFPEISLDRIDKVRGMDIVIVTSAKTDEEARELLVLMGMPFKK